MMKRISIPLLILLLIVSCQENSIVPVHLATDDVMRFNLISSDLQTKVSEGTFEIKDKIGLYVTDYVDNHTPMPLQVSGNRANNSELTYDGMYWLPEQPVYWGEGKSDVYAYYPYIETISDVNELYFEIASDQTDGAYELSDFLWAKAEGVCRDEGAVNLQMKHIMSKLTVNIVAGEDYVGSLPEDASVQLHNTVTRACVNIAQGSLTTDSYSGAKSIRMKNRGVKMVDGVKAVVYEAIVVPQMLESIMPLLEINSKSVSYLLEDRFNFRPGVAYTYTVTLNTSTTAIKVEIGCEIEDWNNAGGDPGNEGGSSEDGSEEEEDTNVYIDLSAAGTTNCYLVQQAGDYKFKAVIGNTDATVGNVKAVEVLWESFGTDEKPNIGDLIASASFKNGYICFSTPENFRNGNAVIAAKNSKGIILWSWHIWCAEEGWQEQEYYNDAGTMMDRNLGATSATPGDVGTLGLMYQWGRKDPFMGSSSISSSVLALSTGTWNIASGGSTTKAEENPMMFYTSMSLPDGSWASTKTAYDPCPYGWRVPDGGEDGIWAKATGSSSGIPFIFDNGGMNLTGKLGDGDVRYPLVGYRFDSSGVLSSVGHYGRYWTCYQSGNCVGYPFQNDVFATSISINSPHGLPVRCQKEE